MEEISPVVNMKMRCRDEVIGYVHFMRRSLDTVENSFINAPMDEDVKHLEIMTNVERRLIKVSDALDDVLRSYIH